MKRYVLNYAGAWLTGFTEVGCSLSPIPGKNRKVPRYEPVWGEKDKRLDFGELAYTIADVILRGGVMCKVVDNECKSCGGQGWYAKYHLNGDPPDQEPCPDCDNSP